METSPGFESIQPEHKSYRKTLRSAVSYLIVEEQPPRAVDTGAYFKETVCWDWWEGGELLRSDREFTTFDGQR
ncbi:MAG: hypothetical protein O7E52_27680 [Candidatus Poribacteria bacterium]|nr:hypothetical protein [Candidatus Poribacteria bacterium]